MGKANYPHDASRPTPKAVKKAIEADDIEALKMSLTVLQNRFAEEYILDFKGGPAVIRAGYSTRHADQQAHTLLHHEGVRYLIDHLTKSKEAKIQSVDPDYIVQRIANIVNADESKASDKLRGLELLARHLGMFVDKTEISGPDGDAIKLQQIREKQIQDDAAAFTSTITGLSERRRKKEEAKGDGSGEAGSS